MIIVNAPIQQDKIIELMENYNQDDVTFKYEKKAGIRLYFSTNSEDKEAAARILKEAVKSEDWGSVLYFQVTTE